MSEKIAKMKRKTGEVLEPPPDMTIDEWADKYRVLPKESSSEHGQWRTSRFPFLREVMRELSPQSPAREVVARKGSQVGFTEVCINKMFYTIDFHPASYLYIQKTVTAVERFSKQRLAPSIEVCPRIKDKIGTAKSRDSSNTITEKKFPGGIIILGGANSAASLRSMPLCHLDADEQDSYEENIQDEGDPTELAIKRTTNFPKRKIFKLSTPKLTETSKILPAFEAGDQRYYFIRCPFCGHAAPIAWKDPGEMKSFTIQYTDDNPNTAALACVECGCLIEEKYKTKMMAEENGAYWFKNNPHSIIPSFCLSGLYSPYGFFSWKQAVQDWLKAQRNFDKELLQVHINTVLAEGFSISGKIIVSSGIKKRCEHYIADVPMQGKFVIASADVQDNRIEAEIIAWGRAEESWSVCYEVFMGDTEGDEVWLKLDAFLQQQWRHESGNMMMPIISMIDSGYRTRKVHSFCRLREHRRVFPIQGVPGWGKGLIDRPASERRHKDGVYVFKAYVDEIKSKFYSQLKIMLEEGEVGKPGYCHFPRKDEYNTRYFDMLTSERLVTKKVRGYPKLEWELPKGKRNEALDIRVYNIAGLNILNPNFDVIDRAGGVLAAPERVVKKRRRILSRGKH